MQQTNFPISAGGKSSIEEHDYRVSILSSLGYEEQIPNLLILMLFVCLRLRTFMQLYQMDCPRATERLLKMGVPEPIKGASGVDAGQVAIIVAETVQHFITTMDAVKLEQRAVDELQPLLSDLMDSLSRHPETPSDFEPNKKVKKWLQKLNVMRAVEQIDEDDARQLYLDLDSAYAEFTRYLKRK
mmetsp:Transcript_16084/g.27225  ORF Transcript_16084/g.27225 Transcript_16084/m.27225 type:complete len:185 (-) Transcript_16084:94-648(-)